jgi:hypothetical protein
MEIGIPVADIGSVRLDAKSLRDLREMRTEEVARLDRMHDVAEMLDRAKTEASQLDITLDFDTCLN